MRCEKAQPSVVVLFFHLHEQMDATFPSFKSGHNIITMRMLLRTKCSTRFKVIAYNRLPLVSILINVLINSFKSHKNYLFLVISALKDMDNMAFIIYMAKKTKEWITRARLDKCMVEGFTRD